MCAVLAYERQKDCFWRVENPKFPIFYPGTGDCFSSVLVGCLLRGESVPIALTRAVEFVSFGIRLTYGLRIPPTDGFLLEKALPLLLKAEVAQHYEEV
ncbi:MAG: pyridoxamine kinase, partial [Desulfovibrio sp.]|nr:pyridoxamine kinase [Desulfovibrio sp.]